MDLVVKWRLFRSLGSERPDAQAEHDYIEHIWRRSSARMLLGLPTDAEKYSLFDYIDSAVALHQSMKLSGFFNSHPIPLDLDGELLNGSHRVACALALGHNVRVVPSPKSAWAPPWDVPWFLQNGFSLDFVAGLTKDWWGLIDDGRKPVSDGSEGRRDAARSTA